MRLSACLQHLILRCHQQQQRLSNSSIPASQGGGCASWRPAPRGRRASAIARQTCIASLAAEVESAAQILDVPAARMIVRGKEKSLRLDDVETLLASKARSPMMPAATSFLVLDN